MPLLCLVIVEMARPGSPKELVTRWRQQRACSLSLDPPANGQLRIWKGLPDGRDWDRLVAIKQRDGWGLVSHRREFVDEKEEIKDRVSF